MTINSPGNLTFDRSDSVTVANTIGGTGSLTQASPGTLTLAGTNTFSGNTLISAGTLALGNNLALQDSPIDTSGAGGLVVTGFATPTLGGLVGSNNLASLITAGYGSVTNLTLNTVTGATPSYSGVIANGAVGMTLTKIGAGTQTLSGINTYTGATNLSAGTLVLSGGPNVLPSGTTTNFTGGSTLNIGSTTETLANITVSNGVTGTVTGSGGVLNVNGNSNVIIGNGTAANTASGNLSLSGVVGNFTGSASTILIADEAGSNQVVATGTLTLGSGTTLSASTIDISSSHYTGGGFSPGAVGTLTVNNGASLSVATLQLATGDHGNNTQTATVNLNTGGTIFAQTILPGTSQNETTNTINFNGGTIENLNANTNLTISALTGTSTGFILGSSGTPTFDITADRTGTVNAVLSGTGSLTKVDSGTLILGAVNTYTGTTTVNGGALTVSGTGSIAGSTGLTVATGAEFNYLPTTVGTMTLGPLSTLSLAPSSTVGLAFGDTVAVTGAATTTSGTVYLNLSGTPANGTTYTLLTAASGSLANAAYVVNGATNYTYTLTVTAGAVTITTTTTPALTSEFWLGGLSGSPGSWATSNGTASNWASAQSGAPTPQTPGSTTTATFSATGASNQGSIILGANTSVAGIVVNDTTPIVLNDDGLSTLTLGTGGITVNNTSGNPSLTLATPIVLGGAQAWSNASTNPLVVSNSVTNGANTLTVQGAGNTTISGAIGNGAGGLTKAGTGTLFLTSVNTYTGATNVDGGTLQLGTGASISTANAINVGGGTAAGTPTIAGGSVSTSLTGNFSFTIGNGSAGTFNISSGSLNVSSATGGIVLGNTGTAQWTQTGGTVTLAGNAGFFTGNGNTVSGTSTMNISGGTLNAGNGNLQFGQRSNSTLSLSNSGVATFGPLVSGGSAASTDTINLGDGATFTGGSNIATGGTSGVLALPSMTRTSGTLTVNFDGGTLRATGSSTAFLGTAAVSVQDAGGIIDNNGKTISLVPVLAHGGVSATDGGLIFKGAGTTTLSGANKYTGPTVVTAGTLKAGVATVGTTSGAFGVGSAVTVSGGATLDLDGFTETIGSLADNAGSGGTITSSTAGAITLTVGSNNSNTSFAGTIQNGSGTISVTKVGTGSLTLGGADTYTGTTTVNGGTLLVTNTTGSATGTGPVSLASGILGGTGTVTSTVTVEPGSTLAPGVAGVGALGTGTLIFQGGSTLALTISGSSTNSLNVTGDVLLGTATLGIALGATPAVNGVFTIINNESADPVNGYFTAPDGVTPLDSNGSSFTVGSTTFRIYYDGGDGNDVVLVEATPAATVYVSNSNFGLSSTPAIGQIIDGDQGTAGTQSAIYGVSAFSDFDDALTAVSTSGTVVVNSGAYSASPNFAGSQTLSLSGNVTLNSLMASSSALINLQSNTLTVGDASDPSIINANFAASSGSLVKVGSDTLTLNGNESFTGTTTVSAGTLVVNSSTDLSSSTSVSAGATLGGAGTLSGSVASLGTVAPAASGAPSTLTIGGLDLNPDALSSPGTLSIDLVGGGTSDLTAITNTPVNLSGATLNLTTSGTIIDNEQFTILTVPGTTGSRTGFFSNGSSITVGSITFSISYSGGDGNDIVLTAMTATVPTVSGTVLNGAGGGWVNITTAGVTTNTFVPGYIENAGASNQHSMVENVVYSFNQAIALSTSNFSLTGLPGSGTTIAPNVVLTPNSDNTVWTVTFTGAGVNTATHSIGDGEYQLILSGLPGLTNNTYNFFRLLGDIDGSGGVDSGDLLTLNGTFLRSPTDPGYLGAMDFDGSNSVDSADLLQFDSNFLHTVPKMSNGLLPN